jgi:hypothetical protein
MHSEYVILIAFLVQELLHESASMLRYNFTAYLVIIQKHSALSGTTHGGYHTFSTAIIKFAALAQ